MTVAYGEVDVTTPVPLATVKRHATVICALRMLTTTSSTTAHVSATITGSAKAVSTGWDHVTQSVMDVLAQIAVTVSTVYIMLTSLPIHMLTQMRTIVSVMTGGQETIAQSTRDGATTNVTAAGAHVPATVTPVLITPTSITTDTVSVTKTGKVNAAALTSENVTVIVNKNLDASAQATKSVPNVP